MINSIDVKHPENTNLQKGKLLVSCGGGVDGKWPLTGTKGI